MTLSDKNLIAKEQASLAAKQLKARYDEYYPFLIDFLKRKDLFKRRISFPLLINPFPDYFAADVRLMIVGQETQGWSMSNNVPHIKDEINDVRVHSLMMLYKNVCLGKDRRSPFWRFARELNRRFRRTGNNPKMGRIPWVECNEQPFNNKPGI